MIKSSYSMKGQRSSIKVDSSKGSKWSGTNHFLQRQAIVKDSNKGR